MSFKRTGPIVKAIAPLLDQYPSKKPSSKSDHISEATRILTTIAKVMTKALASGDTITIQGFGSFRHVHHKERVYPCTRLPGLKGHIQDGFRSTTIVPAHTTVKFIPAKELQLILDHYYLGDPTLPPPLPPR